MVMVMWVTEYEICACADTLNQLEEVAHPQRHTEATASVRGAPSSLVRARTERAYPR
jgi:hypothetical protein